MKKQAKANWKYPIRTPRLGRQEKEGALAPFRRLKWVALSIWHWVVVGIVVMLLFGSGRFSGMMGDVAKGIKEFKKGMAEDDDANAPSSRIEAPAADHHRCRKDSDKQN